MLYIYIYTIYTNICYVCVYVTMKAETARVYLEREEAEQKEVKRNWRRKWEKRGKEEELSMIYMHENAMMKPIILYGNK